MTGSDLRTTILVPLHRSHPWRASLAAQLRPLAAVARILISDADADGGDGTAALLARDLADLPTVTVIAAVEATGGGWVAHANALLARATTPYVMWLPHDDEIGPDWVLEAEAALDADSSAIAACGAIEPLSVDSVGRGFALEVPVFTGLARRADRVGAAARSVLSGRSGDLGILFRAVTRREQVPPLPSGVVGDAWADVLWALHLLRLGRVARIGAVYRKRWYDDSEHAQWSALDADRDALWAGVERALLSPPGAQRPDLVRAVRRSVARADPVGPSVPTARLTGMTWLRDRRVGLAAVTLFTLLAGDAWRYTITWWGWGVVVALILIGWVGVAMRHRLDLRRIPIALGALLTVMTASIAWSAYPAVSALGVALTAATVFVGVVMAHTLSLEQLVRALTVALRFIIGLSLAFELFVAAVLQRPLLPLWVSYEGTIPPAFYWSRALLLEGGRIQGIPGNANLLAFAALLAVIVFAIHLIDRRGVAVAGWAWLGAAVLTLALTRSSTVIVAGVVALAALGVVLWARRLSGRRRVMLYGVTALGAGAAVAAALVFRETLLDLLGRSDDLTGRLDIWAAVVELIEQRPVLGWGWVSYWAPWVEPFDDLVVIRGVTYLQAHNAWLDVMLQLGVVGLVVFAILVATTGVRVLSWSVDAPLGDAPSTPALRALPALLLTVLLVQSLAESRLLIEAGLVLLVYLAVASRVRGVTLPVRTDAGRAASEGRR